MATWSKQIRSWQLVAEGGKPRKRKSTRGSTAAELAILLPVLVLMVMGAMDFTRVFYTAVTVASAARAGAQYGQQNNGKTGDLAGMEAAAKNDAKDVGGVSATATRYCQCSNGVAVDCLIGDCGAYGLPQIYVRVRAEKNFQPILSYPGIRTDLALNKEAVMRAQ